MIYPSQIENKQEECQPQMANLIPLIILSKASNRVFTMINMAIRSPQIMGEGFIVLVIGERILYVLISIQV